jgi:hypothetical protein
VLGAWGFFDKQRNYLKSGAINSNVAQILWKGSNYLVTGSIIKKVAQLSCKVAQFLISAVQFHCLIHAEYLFILILQSKMRESSHFKSKSLPQIPQQVLLQSSTLVPNTRSTDFQYPMRASLVHHYRRARSVCLVWPCPLSSCRFLCKWIPYTAGSS